MGNRLARILAALANKFKKEMVLATGKAARA
jgi:hypothetical protein